MAVVPDATLEALGQIVAGKYFFAAAMTMLFYDHLLTFPLEVQVIWKRPKTYLSALFILVRYYALLAVSVVAFAYFSPTMTREMCGRWMLFLPLGVTMPLALLPGILMSIRVYALYNRNVWILGWLLLYLAAQTGAGLWQYTVSGGTPAPDPLPDNYNFHFCIYLPPKKIGHLSTMYVFMELCFDSMVFLFTVARTTYIHWNQRRRFAASAASRWGKQKEPSSLLLSLFRDGAFYFGVIFSINLVWVIMILHAPTGLRAIASVPSGCFITTMISRITLNLRSTAYGPANLDERTGVATVGFTVSMPLSDMQRTPRGESFTTSATAHIVTTVYNDEGELQDDVETPHSALPFLNGNGYGNDSFGPRAV